MVDLWLWAAVFVAGIAAGAINAVVGSGTLITFPVLVALGVSPVTANVTNAVGLFPGSFAGAWGYRSELHGYRPRALSMSAASVIGGAIGAFLLLVLPASAFQRVAPVLIVIAIGLVLGGRRLNAWLARNGHSPAVGITARVWVVTLLIGIYGGYFGAAQGVLMMGAFAVLISGSVQHHNALKNLLSGVSKLVATLIFIATAHIEWPLAISIAVGSVLGGLLGARIGKRLSPRVLRGIIAIVGIVAVIKLTV